MTSLMHTDVAELWHRIDPKIAPSETENWQIATVANYWNATVSCVEEQGRNKLASAHRTLAKWCEAHLCNGAALVGQWRENGVQTPAALAFNNRILELGAALAAVRDLVEPLPEPKAMATVAIMVWQGAQHVLRARGRPVGTSPNSIAVRFTSDVLIRLGHDATVHAVSHVMRNFVPTRIKKVS
jgi:hypothetical protein